MIQIDVPVGSATYPAFVGGRAVDALLQCVYGYAHVCVVTQRGWPERYAQQLCDRMRTNGNEPFCITVPSGERAKSWRMVRTVTEAMAQAGLDRRSLVIGVGGGVVTDLAGFCAAVYMRGIDVMHVSTTLLGQVDAAVGGKTGINIQAGKNLIGAFWQPRAVAADTDMLATLPKRQLLAGAAEVVKYGWIMDRELLDLCADRTVMWHHPDRLPELVARCIAHKARIVASDEREGGVRAILNYGHTLAHALEALGGYRKMLHGEAVAVGMRAAALIGVQLGITPQSCVEHMESLHAYLGLPGRWPEWADPDEAIRVARSDKKNTGKKIRMVMITSAGNAQLPVAVDEDIIAGVLRQMRTEGDRS